MRRVFTRIALGVALTATAAVGTAALIGEAQAGRCLCPKLYAPVICDNGQTYMNPCLAECRNAKNCVPTGEL